MRCQEGDNSGVSPKIFVAQTFRRHSEETSGQAERGSYEITNI
jgi:hypothetical protein